MNTIDFIRESAIYIANDRPDVYDVETAVEELSTAMDILRAEASKPVESLFFTSYILTRVWDDGVEEFTLSRRMSSVVIVEEEETVTAFAYSDDVDLPHILEIGLDEEDET